MEIKGIKDVYQMRAASGVGKTAKPVESTGASGKESSSVDMINISTEAAFKHKMSAATKQYTSALSEGPSASRMTVLKAKYAGDHCPTSSAEIAGSILGRVFGSNV